MFNISLGELSLVIIAIILVFGVDECKSILKLFKKFNRKVDGYKAEIADEMRRIEHDLDIEDDTDDTILDLDGQPRKRYNLDNVAKLLEQQNDGDNK